MTIAKQAVARIASVTTLNEEDAETFRLIAFRFIAGRGALDTHSMTLASLAADGLTSAPKHVGSNSYEESVLTEKGQALAARVLRWEVETNRAKMKPEDFKAWMFRALGM